jgi:hypothetical protein
MKRIIAAVAGSLLLSTLGASPALAGGRRGEPVHEPERPSTHHRDRVPHVVTFWCLDLNRVWHVEIPIVVGLGALNGGDPGISPYCGDSDATPIVVQRDARFFPGAAAPWFTNKTYPPGYGAALTALGFDFRPRSSSPAEDFLHNMVNIRVVIATVPDDVPVAEYNFDPRRNFRIVRTGDFFFGQYALGSYVDPFLGIDMSVAELNRLPLFGFPIRVPAPVQPGSYRAYVYWSFSQDTWDGLGMDPFENMWPAGESLRAMPAFVVE